MAISIRIIVAVLLFTACSNNQQKTVKTILLKPEIPSNMLITLARTFCYGNCPIYTLTIYADGKVIYAGKKFFKGELKETDKIEIQISKEQVERLVAEFEKANYFSMKNQYDGVGDGCQSYWTDNPSAITSARFGEREKTIRHNYGCTEKNSNGENKVYPQELYNLESKIDEIVNMKQWLEK